MVPSKQQLQAGFLHPPTSARPWVRWWWFANSITPEEIRRELSLMAQAGWGGVELAVVYPQPGSPPGPAFASAEWFALVDEAIAEAARLGLGFDLTFGSGWPFGGPHIQGEARAGTLRAHTWVISGPAREARLELPPLAEGERIIGAFAVPCAGQKAILQSQRELDVEPGATQIVWDVPPGEWRICLLLRSFTGQRVNRCAPGGEGWVHDHLSAVGTEAHLSGLGTQIVRHLGHRIGQGLGALFCDSWEVLGPYWSPAFSEEFARRRGYDLRPYLPALLGVWAVDDPDALALLRHVRCDYNRVLSELIIENFYEPYTRWCHAHGLRSRVQAHGMPGDVLRAYGTADIPEGEMLLYPLEALRLAASAGHLYNRPIISSESFTCLYGWPNVKQFAERPDDLKLLADAQFACGINRVLFHGYPSSPPEAGDAPGWTCYATCHFNHNITWFRYLGKFIDYVARISFLLQQGQAATDFALYLPLYDLWYAQPYLLRETNSESFQWAGARIQPEPPQEVAGYTWDWVNDHALLGASVVEGSLRIGEQDYAAMVLPPLRWLPLDAAQRLLALAQDGATLIVLDPQSPRVPGLRGRVDDDELAKVWRQLLAQPRTVTSLEAFRALSGLVPDLQLLGDGSQRLPWWAHRRMGPVEIYFIAHPQADRLRYPLPYHHGLARQEVEPVVLQLQLRAQGDKEIWDPETGTRWGCAEGPLQLHFGAHESYIIVVSPPGECPPAPPPVEPRHRLPIPSCDLQLPDGRLCPNQAFVDWRALPELRDFAGSLNYYLTLDVPTGAKRVLLDLGTVEHVAEVFIGERSVGARIWAPYRFELTPWLQPGVNRVRVVVTNLLYNRIQGIRQRQGVSPLPGLRPEEWQQVVQLGLVAPVEERIPSGLLGPVTLLYDD